MPRTGTICKTFTHEGKRYYVYGSTEAEVSEKLRKRKESLRSGLLFEDWARQCLKTYRSGVAQATFRSYEQRIESAIIPHFRDKRLPDITELDCQRCLAAQVGKSQYQIDQIRQWLSFIFKKAVTNNLITANPAADLSRPRGSKKSHRALSDPERKAFLLTAQDPIYLPYLIMYYLGCRPAEMYRLTAADISGHVMHLRGTKSAAADRFVPIPDELAALLVGKSGYLARSYTGLPLDRHRSTDLFRRLKRDMSRFVAVRDDFQPYDLRHDYCTRLCKAGVDIRTAQYLMGHSDITLTANIYTHIGQEDAEELYHILYHAEPQANL